jgi:hypothetical protein
MLTHGDGVDSKMMPGATLCSVVGRRVDVGGKAPLCVETGHCHRHAVPIDTAQRQGKLVDTGMLSARVLVLYTCQGMLHPAGTVGNEWGLAPTLMANARIGALITSAAATLTQPSGLFLLNYLLQRVPAGRAVALFNGSRFARQLGNRLFLLGDPATCTVSQPAGISPSEVADLQKLDVPRVPNGRTPWVEHRARSLSGDLQFLHCLVANGESGQIGAASVLRYLEVVRDDVVSMDGLRAATIAYALEGGIKSTAGWMWLADHWRPPSYNATCFTCGRRCTELAVDLRLPNASNRKIVICPCCGLIGDTPADGELAFKVDVARGVIRWTRGRPSRQWAAGVFVRGKDPAESFGVAWPNATGGSPATTLRLERPIPYGPVRIYLYLMHADRLSLAIVATRGTAAVTEWRSTAVVV